MKIKLKVSKILPILFVFSVMIRMILIKNIRVYPATDEIWAYFLTHANFMQIWMGTLSEFHPPFYFLAAHALSLIVPFNLDVNGLRLLSLVFGVFANFGVYFLGRIVDKRVGIIAFLLSLFFPSFIWSSVFARYYSFLMLLTSVVVLLFISWIKTGKNRYFLPAIILSAVGSYTHYYFFLLDLAFLVYIFWSGKIVKKWLLALLSILILISPELYFLFSLQKPEIVGLANNILKIPALFIVNVTSWELLVNIYYTGNPLVYMPTFILLGICITLLLVIGFKNLNSNYRMLFFSVIFIPVLLAAVASFYRPLFGIGSFQIFIPVFLVVLANGIFHSLRKIKILTVGLALSTLISLGLFFGASESLTNYREDIKFIKENFKEGDILLHAHLYSFIPARYYLGENINFALNNTTSSTPPTEEVLGYKLITEQAVKQAKRVWYLEPPLGSTDLMIKTKKLLDENFIVIFTKKFPPLGLENGDRSFTLFNVYLYQTN